MAEYTDLNPLRLVSDQPSYTYATNAYIVPVTGNVALVAWFTQAQDANGDWITKLVARTVQVNSSGVLESSGEVQQLVGPSGLTNLNLVCWADAGPGRILISIQEDYSTTGDYITTMMLVGADSFAVPQILDYINVDALENSPGNSTSIIIYPSGGTGLTLMYTLSADNMYWLFFVADTTTDKIVIKGRNGVVDLSGPDPKSEYSLQETYIPGGSSLSAHFGTNNITMFMNGGTGIYSIDSSGGVSQILFEMYDDPPDPTIDDPQIPLPDYYYQPYPASYGGAVGSASDGMIYSIGDIVKKSATGNYYPYYAPDEACEANLAITDLSDINTIFTAPKHYILPRTEAYDNGANAYTQYAGQFTSNNYTPNMVLLGRSDGPGIVIASYASDEVNPAYQGTWSNYTYAKTFYGSLTPTFVGGTDYSVLQDGTDSTYMTIGQGFTVVQAVPPEQRCRVSNFVPHVRISGSGTYRIEIVPSNNYTSYLYKINNYPSGSQPIPATWTDVSLSSDGNAYWDITQGDQLRIYFYCDSGTLNISVATFAATVTPTVPCASLVYALPWLSQDEMVSTTDDPTYHIPPYSVIRSSKYNTSYWPFVSACDVDRGVFLAYADTDGETAIGFFDRGMQSTAQIRPSTQIMQEGATDNQVLTWSENDEWQGLDPDSTYMSAFGAKQDVSLKGQPNGYAGLDSSGRLSEDNIIIDGGTL